MLEMLKARKEQLQAQGKKGFTLMEMLIVIAIIAILIAIAIPLFTSQLNAAKQAADEANARSLYALLMADYMDDGKGVYNNAPSGSIGKSSTVTVGTTTFTFSDVTTAGSISATNGTEPTVSITTNGTTFTFPGNTSGTPAE